MTSSIHDSAKVGERAKLRWGILGAADIARKNWKAIWNSKNGRVAGVASRDILRCQRFIDQCQKEAPFAPPPRAFENYDELLSSAEIDAVYVPLPTGVRQQWVRRAALEDKHVVCEKPCATSVAELLETLELCRRRGVQFMDGVMFTHSRRLERILDSLNTDRIVGQIRRIGSVFTFNQEEKFFATNIRARSELEPDGCLGDLGWYCIRFALCVMGGRLPVRAAGRILREYRHNDSMRSVPAEFSGEMFFENGISSTFYCSFVTELEQWAVVSGTKGNLRVDDFVLPFSGKQIAYQTSNPVFLVSGCDFEMRPQVRNLVVDEPSHGHPTAQETNLFRKFAEQVWSGEPNPAWPDIALKTQRVMEACRESSRTEGKEVRVSS